MKKVKREFRKIVIVTGLSGAGKTTALKIFEDIGYDAIDNLPSKMMSIILNKSINGLMAIGIDIRSREFDGKEISKFLLKNKNSLNINIIFFDCETSVLINRFKESRRRHPLKLDIPIADIIKQERLWLEPLKKISDYSIDTSNLTVPNLNKTLQGDFSTKDKKVLTLRILSFGYKFGIPREADLVVDMRFLENPFYIKSLQKLTGKDQQVINFINGQKIFKSFFKKYLTLFNLTSSSFLREGKKYLTIAFGCTGGIHRSVVMAEKFYKIIDKHKFTAFIDHRDLKR